MPGLVHIMPCIEKLFSQIIYDCVGYLHLPPTTTSARQILLRQRNHLARTPYHSISVDIERASSDRDCLWSIGWTGGRIAKCRTRLLNQIIGLDD